MNHELAVSRETLERYDRPGPRYTSYPTVPEWSSDFASGDYADALARAAQADAEPVALYVHIPFCGKRCAYCGCNTVVPTREDEAERYLSYVDRELTLVGRALEDNRKLAQIHLGGGTPTYLSCDQLKQLIGSIEAHIPTLPDAEKALEADARVTTREQLETLRALGFSRISMGVQDLHPVVQKAIGREQTLDQTRALYDLSRDLGFAGVNMDLVYGLPEQTPERWATTLQAIIDMKPDRLAVYSFAYLPARLPNQEKLNADALPTGAEKYELFAMARSALLEAGYRAIGMDHFALPTDELAIAMDERRLRRNFMGYTVIPADEMIGVGASAIGEIGECYAQNVKSIEDYYAALDAGAFATEKGCWLSQDDTIRAWVIRQLMCNFHLEFAEFRKRFGQEFSAYFADELSQLPAFEQDEFIAMDDTALSVLPLGRVFVRNIAMVFDAYLKKGGGGQFSRTV